MLVLELTAKKELKSKETSCNFTGENNFEKIRIVASPIISDKNLTDLKAELYIYNIINVGWTTFNDCIPCEFTMKNGYYISEFPVKAQYTAYPKLGMYLKFTDENGMVGQTNAVEVNISYHPEKTIDVSNSIELFEKNKNEIEKASLKVPYIGEDGFWYVYRDGEYVRTDFPAQGEQGIKGEKGNKGDKGDNYVLTEADKKEIANMAADIYNESNIETGTGTLTTITSGYTDFFSEAIFNYIKIKNYVIVNFSFTNAETVSSFTQFNLRGLPFISNERKNSSYVIYTNANNYTVQFTIRPNNPYLTFYTSNLSQGNLLMNPTIIYQIKEE